jgi:hypothetical protein
MVSGKRGFGLCFIHWWSSHHFQTASLIHPNGNKIVVSEQRLGVCSCCVHLGSGAASQFPLPRLRGVDRSVHNIKRRAHRSPVLAVVLQSRDRGVRETAEQAASQTHGLTHPFSLDKIIQAVPSVNLKRSHLSGVGLIVAHRGFQPFYSCYASPIWISPHLPRI